MGMKKTLVVAAIALLFPVAAVYAFRGDGGGNPGGGNRDGGSGGDHGGAGWGNGGSDSSVGSWDNGKGGSALSVRAGRGNRSGGGFGAGKSLQGSGNPGSGRFKGFNGGSNQSSGFHWHGSSSHSLQAFKSGRGFNTRGLHSSTVPQRFQRMGITGVPKPLGAHSLLPNRLQRASFRLPNQGPSGRRISAAVVSPRFMSSPTVMNHMSSIARNRAFRSQINSFNRAEVIPNHYYWHTWNGNPYCHYYDRYGCNWYGWYYGGSCFWTQYYADNWWWYDDWADRWCYWDDGGWWWQNPGTAVVYVYHDGDYTPAANGNDNGEAEADNKTFRSKDGNLTVKVTTDGDAFLYGSDGNSKPAYLASNVTGVKFSNPDNGNSQILVTFKDGSFELFNLDGSPANGMKG